MSKQARANVIPSGGLKYKDHHPIPLQPRGKLSIGIDVGSISSDMVVLDEKNNIVFSNYQRTEGKPIETASSQLHKLLNHIAESRITSITATGSAGRFLAELMNITFVNEVPAQAKAISLLYPHLKQATIIEMGGQDSKLIFLATEKDRLTIKDFTMNTVCAAGTGSFLDQQAQRLGINIENQFGRMALKSKTIPRMAGRCSVFAKSDMIHLQQQATPTCDIIAGLCLALARNLKSNLGSGRKFVKPIIFTGGVAANIGVVRALEKAFELQNGQLLVPKAHFFTGAIGSILMAKAKNGRENQNLKTCIKRINNYLSQQGTALKKAPRRQPLTIPTLPLPKSIVHQHLLADATRPIDAYLGVDVGSISTNVAVIDKEKRVLAKAYLMTAGKPLEAVRKGLDIVGKKVAKKVKILGAATTGSGRYLTGDFIGADIVINEITAQAAGTAIINPRVDTIFEIGGQDSKYISLENGVVVDFEMNHACAAGTGSFIEEQAQRLGIDINHQFADLALKSSAPIKLGERCTVFMESDLLSYQQQGARTSDLVAGLSYSIVTNYLNRVVGRRKIGNNICFQGGTAFNKAVWSAFEKVTGKPIMVPDHHEVTGAIGAAAIAAEYMKKTAEQNHSPAESKFRGFKNLISVKYSVESFTCEHCPNHCEIKKVQLPQADPLYYGSRCDRYNLKRKEKNTKTLGAFEHREKRLLEYAGLTGKPKTAPKTIGIPMTLISWQLLPMFARFFKSLGFEVVLSSRTNKKLIRMGVESVTAQLCFPVKTAYGHIAELLEKKPDYIFLPSIVSMPPPSNQNKHSQFCPYVQSFAYQVGTAFADRLGRTKLLTPAIRLGEGPRLLRKTFLQLAAELHIPASATRKAIAVALATQDGFEQALKEKGKEILRKIGPHRKLFVLVSRPYNGCDPGLNLQLPKKLSELGAEVIPMDMLDLEQAELGDKKLHRDVYWTYGQKILRAAEIIKNDPRLFAIYLSNFGCGPDSFLLTFFKDIMGRKPCLQLELDEHSADAGVITRLEAFLESLKNYKDTDQKIVPQKPLAATKPLTRHHKLYIPYMSDCAYGIAACFSSHGQPAEVMPLADEKTLLQGRAFTTGKECLPCAITAGDMLKVINKENFDPQKTAFFMPTASGPCRFGMYNCMHRLILKYAGAEDVPIISPNQDGSFYREFTQSINGSGTRSFMKDLWIASVGIDLLHKLLLKLRPIAADSSGAQQVYNNAIKRWIQAVENRTSLPQMKQLMTSITEEFAAVKLDPVKKIQKPRIGIVGEIYVRSHPFANMNIIDRMEKLGAACDLAPLAEWVYYTNFARKQNAKRTGRLRNFFTDTLIDRLQHRIEKILAEPLEEKFGPLAERPIEHVIELAAPYLHRSVEGEAILSIGKTIEYCREGFGGVINVMPFSCMPSTVVSSYTRRISADCGNMPILNLSFDGQEDSTLTTRLEAFVEQVRQRHSSNVPAAELVTL